MVFLGVAILSWQVLPKFIILNGQGKAMKPVYSVISVVIAVMLAGCSAPPPIDHSREVLWQQFGQQPVDKLLMAWGTPARETRLTDDSRMVVYRHATIYESGSPYERQTGCEVTFMAQSPGFRIANIAMEGEAYECAILAQGRTGDTRHVYMPEPVPYYGHQFHYPF